MADQPAFSDREDLRRWYSTMVGDAALPAGGVGVLLRQTGVPCYTCLRILHGTDEVHNTVRTTNGELSTFQLHHRHPYSTATDPEMDGSGPTN